MAHKTKSEFTQSLSGQLAAAGMHDAEERLRWMILTWDLALPGEAEQFARVFLSDDNYTTFTVPRSERLFARRSPHLGKLGTTSSYGNPHAAEMAEEFTDTLIAAGWAPVCVPLAVDVYGVGRTLRDSTLAAPGAGHLVNLLQAGAPMGLEALAHINTVRYDALETHLDEDWEKHFDHEHTTLLWDGYGPEEKSR